MSEDDLVNSIVYHYGLEKEVVREYRGIDSRTAVERFLSKDSREQLKGEGYDFDDDTRDVKLKFVMFNFHLPKFRDDFCKTKEGSLWYELNVVVPCAMAGQMVSDLTSQLFSGNVGSCSPAEKVALSTHIRITQDVQRYAMKVRAGQRRASVRRRNRRRPRFIRVV